MNDFHEKQIMSKFMVHDQQKIVEEIVDTYNLTNLTATKAALANAAWLGFLAGLEYSKKME